MRSCPDTDIDPVAEPSLSPSLKPQGVENGVVWSTVAS